MITMLNFGLECTVSHEQGGNTVFTCVLEFSNEFTIFTLAWNKVFSPLITANIGEYTSISNYSMISMTSKCWRKCKCTFKNLLWGRLVNLLSAVVPWLYCMALINSCWTMVHSIIIIIITVYSRARVTIM